MKTLIYCIFCIVICASNCLAKLSHRHHQKLAPPPIAGGVHLPPDEWFEQNLDHFDPTNDAKWKQRYFINSTFYKPGGPLFIMIGGEGEASAKWMVTGSWVEYGKQYGAILMQLEHRFYGKSHPTADLSSANLRFLSSEQALADLAYFVTKIKETFNLTEENKVVAFGGSYPGSLAVWFRLKYPHIVHASVSSSAPLIAQINFKEYLEVVHDSIISKGSVNCLKAVNKATKYVNLLLQHRVGWQTLEKSLRLCKPLNGTNEKDVSNLFELLAENFEDVVQYNEDNRAFEGVKGTNITIDVMCDIMTDEKIGNSFERYVKVNSLILDTYGNECLDHTYKSLVDSFLNTTWPDNPGVGGRQWIYQTCTEFGFYQSSDSTYQPFGSNFPIQFFTKQCADIYGPKYTEELLKRGVDRTNIMYGGQSPKVTRVVLINGSIDPWHFLGVTKPKSDLNPVIFINGTAHCANMYPASESDSVDLIEARTTVKEYIGKWLKEE